ncbi:MAG: hypothetical protein JSV84_10700 [Gemmatimonadota bacterium]|nr:MAG: hypothetical protein JSV84_10700 [Gemmatimonadota bacterium]
MKTTVFLLIVGILFLAVGLPGDVSAKGQEKKIVFLNLTMEDDGFTLEKIYIRPGSLKEKSLKNRGSQFTYVMLSRDGDLIGEGAFKDPRVNARRLEYEDPHVPGAIRKIHVLEETRRFVLRLPYHEDLARVDLFKTPTGSKARVQDEETVDRVKIGSIQINLEDAK